MNNAYVFINILPNDIINNIESYNTPNYNILNTKKVPDYEIKNRLLICYMIIYIIAIILFISL